MSSNQIPRGWHVAITAVSPGPSAVIGVGQRSDHGVVITEIRASILYYAGMDGDIAVNVTLGPPGSPLVLGSMLIVAALAASGAYTGKDTFTWTGEVHFPANASGVVAISQAPIAGETQYLEVLGYDI